MITISIRINRNVLLGAILFSFAASCFAMDFQRLLDAPTNFHQKRVTLAGLAHVSGDGFFLYQDAANAAKANPSTAVFVSGNLDPQLYDNFNNRWLRVTGMVNAKAHGLLGSAACELNAEKIERISKPAEADPDTYAIFRNDGSQTVNLTIPAPGGHTDVDLRPGRSSSRAAIAKGVLVVRTVSGKVVAKSELGPLNGIDAYFDRKRRTYYYRIIGHRVEIVTPKEAAAWPK